MFKANFLSSYTANKKVSVDGLIGNMMIIKGNISFEGGLNVDGKIIGNIEANSSSNSLLILSSTSQIKGIIKVPNIVINGRVDGDVFASGHLELSTKASITGNVYYSVLKMSAGAKINGSLVYKPNEQNPKLEHKNKSKNITKPIIPI
ncbi:MAG: hypothetical protein DRQ51_04355 [Gammaproteobacteria bacterium]|nr:MAG: hypothetical protein DRQ51_04355 [Gammaproteobacteria bacterium]